MNQYEALPCADKLSFDTEKLAKATAVVANHQRGQRLKPYKCKHCDLWHLASS